MNAERVGGSRMDLCKRRECSVVHSGKSLSRAGGRGGRGVVGVRGGQSCGPARMKR